MEKIVLIGNGGHAKSIVDSIESANLYEIVGFIAADTDDTFEYRGYGIIGTDDDLQKIYESGIRSAFICIGYMGNGSVREQLYEKVVEMGFSYS